jgi:thioredoxin
MANVIKVQDFVKNVKENEGIAVVDFFATWCGPCNMLAPVFTEVAEEHKDSAYFAKVDVDESMELAQEFGVSTVPTVVFFKGGKEVSREIGFMPKEKIESILAGLK